MRLPASHRTLLVPLLAAAVAAGCGAGRSLFTTRVETETHPRKIVTEQSRSEPLGEEYGVLKPSRRQTITDRRTLTYDSICARYYPAFARYGLFEVSGLVTGIDSDERRTIGNGLFGVYNTFGLRENRNGATLNGYLFRFGTWDGRLRFIGKDWVGGTSIVEGIFGDGEDGNQLVGIFPMYLKKRIFLRDETPYLFVEPFAGASVLGPYRYIHLGASLNLGSSGGANIIVRLGLAAGAPGGDASAVKSTRVIPYAGLGLSMFDFVNTEKEMDTPWKEHKTIARRTGLFHLTLLQSSTGSGDGVVFQEKGPGERRLLTDFDGFILQFGTVAFPADFIGGNFNIGTSVINLMYLGSLDIGASILPLRLAYRYAIWRKLFVEPFVELNYYPSSVAHAGARMNLGDFAGLNIGLQVGGMYGNTGELTRNLFEEYTADIRGIYAGLTIGLFDFYSSPIIDNYKDHKDCRTPFGDY